VVNELPAGVSLVEIGRPQLKGLDRVEPVYQLRHERLPGATARLPDVVHEPVRPALPLGLAAYEREPLVGRGRGLGGRRGRGRGGAGGASRPASPSLPSWAPAATGTRRSAPWPCAPCPG